MTAPWDAPEPNDDVIQLGDYTLEDYDHEDPDSPLWGRTIRDPNRWKGYKNGGKIYLEWEELNRRWGPLNPTMWETLCDGSTVGCPPGEHKHVGGIERGAS